MLLRKSVFKSLPGSQRALAWNQVDRSVPKTDAARRDGSSPSARTSSASGEIWQTHLRQKQARTTLVGSSPTSPTMRSWGNPVDPPARGAGAGNGIRVRVSSIAPCLRCPVWEGRRIVNPSRKSHCRFKSDFRHHCGHAECEVGFISPRARGRSSARNHTSVAQRPRAPGS